MCPSSHGLRPSMRQLLLPFTVFLILFGLPYLLGPIAHALLVIFAGVLLAVFLDGLARLLRRAFPWLPQRIALFLGVLLVVAFFFTFSFLAGPRIAEQASQLIERLPQSLQGLQESIQNSRWLRGILPSGGGGGLIPALLGEVSNFFSIALGWVTNTVIILFLGIYLAFDPGSYARALLFLLPAERRARGEEILDKVGQGLRWWLIGRFSAMTVVGVLTAIGLLIISEPLALVLGLIAALLSFIPFLGPVLSALPAVLIGLSRSLLMAGWVVLVYVVVQFFESNLITPLIQKRAVMLPPAFLIAAQFILGVLLGFFGILLATPLTVLLTILFQMLYIEGILGDRVQILGEHGGNSGEDG